MNPLLKQNLPNLLTFSRIAMALVLLLLLVHLPEQRLLAAGVFALAMATDFLDGYLARRWNQITLMGQIFDPLADKLVMLAGFLGLLTHGSIDALAVFLILSRELFITGLRVFAAGKQVDVSASWLGKAKTVLQSVALLWLLLALPYGHEVLWLAVAVTLYSGYEYARSYFRVL